MTTKHSAIIIGVGPGLGLALARKFGHELGEVALIARSPAHLAPLLQELKKAGITAHGFAADAADLNGLRATIRQATSAMSPLKALIYNAAAIKPCRAVSLEPEGFAAELVVDVVAPLAAAQAAAPVLEANGGGSVLFTGGGFAIYPYADMAALSAGKAALRNLTATLAEDLEPKGIRTAVVTICGYLAEEGRFAPATVADAYWNLHVSPAEDRKPELTYA
ncbi:SDR family NAD(P)-dependent oxidoreductase [Azospirillum brasilense]|uniref:SDR family NAD(P)-dependent oxidoreductase n=1 Tax=Azospirillum brasilense TaxID=192 RepID=A0A6L3B5D1_AZOBR|nr:SDR family NAD(P)-dependent oxidoreductase [Azospirillum brasilense]KAA0688205.1 SDR family NAD(P)-dependent oxidoreductase [Azospirillum brasilense]